MVRLDVTVARERQVQGPAADELWRLYERSFDQLRVLAAQRHLMERKEFQDVMADSRVLKLIAREPERGRPYGVATLTNELAAMSLISPDYFANRWPDLFRRNLIWYVGFLFVDPEHRCSNALSSLIGQMCAQVSDTGGVIAADFCEHNEHTYRLPTLLARVARAFAPGIAGCRLDAQVYWAYEFPAPA